MGLPKFSHLVRRFKGHRVDLSTVRYVYLDVLVVEATKYTIELEDGTQIYIGDVESISLTV